MDREPQTSVAFIASGQERRGFSWRQQFASLAPLVVVWGVGIAVLVVARFQTATSLSSLVLDPAFLSGHPWYTGAISNLGILVWAMGVAFALAGAWVAKRIGRTSAAHFLAVGAFATLVLLFDDVFRFHTGPLNRLLGSKTAAQGVVIFPVGVWLALFYKDVLRTRWFLLLVALGSLGASVSLDIVLSPTGDTALLLEDGLKFLGILTWSFYFAATARDIAASAISSGLQAAAQPTEVTRTVEVHEAA